MALPNIQDYYVPGTRQEAVELLGKFGENAMLVAGGTFVHGLEVRGVLGEIEALIDIGQLGLAGIRSEDGKLVVGATTNFGEIQAHADIASAPHYAAIIDALTYPPAQIINVGTIGGCIAASAPLYDLPCALSALDASLRINGGNGAREVALGEFFTGLFENVLASNELITEVVLPAAPANTASAFLKLETNANDLAIVNLAVRLTVDSAGNCADTRVYVGGGIGESYARAVSAEAVLNGAPAEAASFDAASEAVVNDIEPVDDHRASAAYRAHIVKVYTRRCLATALERLG
ncbi:MAG: FAD binding domain-containing protein [Chromatiales bacterium]|nr:MAG: FAD binding domain-containing protein [Chromatiales bacterium]